MDPRLAELHAHSASTRTADTLYSGVPISGSPTSCEQPVHLRLREVERHPDEARVDALGVVRVAPPARRAARRAARPRRRRSRARPRPRRLISKNGRSCFSTTPGLAHRHRRRVVVVERPAGREDERELRVGLLDRRLVLDREEPPASARERRRRRVQVRRARIVEVGARPLDPVLLDPRVADAVPVRAEVGELVPDVLGRLVRRATSRRAPPPCRRRSASPRAPRPGSRAPSARGSRAARCS